MLKVLFYLKDSDICKMILPTQNNLSNIRQSLLVYKIYDLL